MSLTYILILVFIGLFIIVFMYVEPLLSKHKIKNSNEYGSARFAHLDEIKRDFKRENLKEIKEVGFPIYFDKGLENVWMDKETPHWVYLGSTGSGKSVTQVIPFCSFLSIAKEKRSAFITDPKGEIFQKTSKMFKDRGYEVLTIDFRNPERSCKFNILEPIIKEWELYIDMLELYEVAQDEESKTICNNKAMSHFAETNRLITSLADMITSEKVEAKDPFWNNSARQLLEGLIGFFLEEYKLGNMSREKITMTSIRKFQNSMLDERNAKKFKEYLETREYGSKSKDSLTSVITASENTYKSITSVFGNKMNIFDDINVANVTSSYDSRFNELGTKPTVLYVIVPDEDKTYFTLVSIIVGLLYKELVKVANSNEEKRLPVQVDWILDEFANCPPLTDIEAMVSVARSRGMRFHFFIQSFAQLDNVYGKDVAQIILDNCGLVYLKTNTQDTAEAISRRLGKKTIESNSISQSMSLNNYNGNKSTSLMARELLTADEIKQLHYKMIIFPTTGYPIFRNTIIYKDFKIYKSGTLDREIHNLENLNYTYYTVEQIPYEMKEKNNKRGRNSRREQDTIMQEEDIDKQKNLFDDILTEIKRIYVDVDMEIRYSNINNRVVLNIESGKVLSKQQMLKLSADWNKSYYLEFKSVENKQVINIHFLNLDKSLGK